MNIVRRHVVQLSSLPALAASSLSAKSKVGGQAIIEGVMMRGPAKVSWAVRKPNGEIAVEEFPFVSASKKNKMLGLPVIRGAVNLWETLVLGYKSILRSADLSMEQPETQQAAKSFRDKLFEALSLGASLLIAVGLFMYLPLWLLTAMGMERSAFAFNLYAGMLRLGLFVAYLLAVSLWKDMRRLFEYHGAEHKAIFTYEDGKDLTLENMKSYTTHHPRCGTSFILLVAVVCILLFGIVDAIVVRTIFVQSYPSLLRLLVHLVLIVPVSGTSYEILKLSDRYQNRFPVNMLIQPGLWLQRITTRPPDDGQLDVASRALKAAL